MKPSQITLIILAAMGGWCLARFMPSSPADTSAMARKIVMYQSTMHPWVKSDKPGQCTICDMALVPIYEGGRNFDGKMTDMVILPSGSPNVVGVQVAEVKKQPLVRTLRVSG